MSYEDLASGSPGPQPDITAIITGHGEGAMAGISVRSMLDAVQEARESGLTVELMLTLDRPTKATEETLGHLTEHGFRRLDFDLGDQGLVRNEAVKQANGRYIAFLDADDLWSANWLVEAHRVALTDPGRVIVHPEYNWFFDGDNAILLKTDDRDEVYDPEFLRFSNYWDALCLCPRDIYLAHPFCVRDVAGGFAYEDWHWNCETVAAGLHHHVALDTIHFKRRREGSQTMQASKAKVMMRPTPLLRYDWFE